MLPTDKANQSRYGQLKDLVKRGLSVISSRAVSNAGSDKTGGSKHSEGMDDLWGLPAGRPAPDARRGSVLGSLMKKLPGKLSLGRGTIK